MNWREHIMVHPAIYGGQAYIKGTHVMVSAVLDRFAAGQAVDDVLNTYPPLKPEDIRASLAYAAELARERITPLPAEAACW